MFRKEKDEETDVSPRGSGRMLYDVPYMFEARELLRKKLIGKKVMYNTDLIDKSMAVTLQYNIFTRR